MSAEPAFGTTNALRPAGGLTPFGEVSRTARAPDHVDVQQIEVLLVPETDDWVNPLGVKGLGELGNVGLNAAVANAVLHATGKRIRDLPVRIEKLIA